jgi:hypothetical protein
LGGDIASALLKQAMAKVQIVLSSYHSSFPELAVIP